jgi:hypothetical protein
LKTFKIKTTITYSNFNSIAIAKNVIIVITKNLLIDSNPHLRSNLSLLPTLSTIIMTIKIISNPIIKPINLKANLKTTSITTINRIAKNLTNFQPINFIINFTVVKFKT